jgi:hypothetical protein
LPGQTRPHCQFVLQGISKVILGYLGDVGTSGGFGHSVEYLIERDIKALR